MNCGQLTLGQLIARLKKEDADDTVQFDFGGLSPTHFGSYRGCYEDLALGFTEDSCSASRATTVGELLKRAEQCIGATFTGYKGGEYTMGDHTGVWVANPGGSTGTGLMGVVYREGIVILTTDMID